jgi:phosphoenolpyruvate synthase/pyruvate phosphate dikinase
MRLLTLEEVACLPVSAVGGKASGLARLVELGVAVPPARVLTVDGHTRYLRDRMIDRDLRGALAEAATTLRSPLAVRSSAVDEDLAGKSAAGQYESMMGLRSLEDLCQAVEHCYEAADSKRVRVYQGDSGSKLALIIQEQVRSQRSGVAFSLDPVSRASDAVIIEAVFGHGDGLVSGELAPDRYAVSRSGGAVQARRARKLQMSDGDQLDEVAVERQLARVLRDDEAQRVAAVVLAAEQGFGAPVDVEFCWTGQELWLVQCRPITTIGADLG